MSAEEAFQSIPYDQPEDDPRLVKIASLRFDGDEMIEGLKRGPKIRLGEYEVDFASEEWRFPHTNPKVPANRTKSIRFDSTCGEDAWKLWIVCQVVWKERKVRSATSMADDARRMFKLCKGEDARTTVIDYGDYRECIESHAHWSCGAAYSMTRALRGFLVFRETFFGLRNDRRMMRALSHDVSENGLRLTHSEGTPPIDNDYLEPLVETCYNVLHDDAEGNRARVIAASILLASQMGMRISELRTLETGCTHVERVSNDIQAPYLRYKAYKPAKGDHGHKLVKAYMNPLAYETYTWLEENCRMQRERIGTSALVVTPEQRVDFIGRERLRLIIKAFILAHHDTIPCINTQDAFPNMQTTNAARIAELNKMHLDRLGLVGGETLVYPKFHSFRPTVATKLYENGADIYFIAKQLGHSCEDITMGYIRSDREIEKAYSEAAYTAFVEDGAEFIGPNGDDFMRKVERTIQNLPEHVKKNTKEVVDHLVRSIPLRKKVAGICTRCGDTKPCKRNDETDQIYCAFGVCPYQCVLYFFADQSLEMVREHIEIVKINVERGRDRGAEKELRKAHYVIKNTLIPELDSLESQLEKHGRDHILARFPDLDYVIDNLDNIREEVAGWLAMSIQTA